MQRDGFAAPELIVMRLARRPVESSCTYTESVYNLNCQQIADTAPRELGLEQEMTNDQVEMRNELLEQYAHVNLKYGTSPRTTALEVLLRCAANEVVFSRFPSTKRNWANKLPLETKTVLGDFIKAVRMGTESEFNARLPDITAPEERRYFITLMNARNTFIDDGDWMRNVAEVMYAIDLVQSYD
ncbi:MAG TPA: hypothetical protein VF389_07945 [Woeseiaceae bacterium]